MLKNGAQKPMILMPDTRVSTLHRSEAIQAFRIVKAKYADHPLHIPNVGHRANRWNLAETPMIYFGSTPSMAALEMQGAIANFGPYGLFRMFSVWLPSNSVLVLLDADYPRDWKEDPHPISTQTLGSQWQREGTSLALLIRSARSPLEYNLLVNPQHSQFAELQIEQVLHHPLSHLDSTGR